jgi:hypothetical protein
MCFTNLRINQQSFLIHEKHATSALLVYESVSLSFRLGFASPGKLLV